jgi:hypothetical protein
MTLKAKHSEPALAGKLTFASMQELYAIRGGEFSAECDLGVWWHGEHPFWPHYRLTWIEDTGDLVLYDPSCGRVTLLAVIPPDTFPEDNTDARRYMVLDRDESRPLYDWAEHCGPVNGLDWIRKQVRRWEAFA